MFPDRQDLSGLWQAIRRLSGRSAVSRLRFVGRLPPETRKELDASGLVPRVEETGFLPKEQAERCLADSSALLLAGPSDGRPVLRGWIPAKLFEYLATDLPIIYIGHSDSDAAELLRHHPGCYILEPRDVDGMIDALNHCPGQRHQRDVSALMRRTLTGKLADLLDQASART
jgi:glycosyltransferase involved in cell wall biosynthesis